MPRDVVALVPADDFVAAVRIYADRVHDLLRRSGCGPEESVEVCESYAFALLDALVNAPETVGDMAGWWFGRALDLGRRLGDTAAEPAGEVPSSVLAGTAGEQQVRAGLAALPETERAAVMLRDAYDLPTEAVAVALRRDVETAAAAVAAGRLRLVAAYEERPIPDLAGHVARTPADLGVLSRLADGSLPTPRAVALNRHLAGCAACEEVVEALARAQRLTSGLPVLAMPDDAREAMLERLAARASSVLPTVDEVLVAIEEDDLARPAISPLVAALAVVVALVLGIGLAAALSSRPSGRTAAEAAPAVTATSPPPSTSAPAASTSATASGSRSPTSTPTTTSPPPPTATPATSAPSSSAAAAIEVSPTRGPRNTQVTVTGSDWPPGAVVTVSYVGSLSSSSQSTTVDGTGHFTVAIAADGTLPGRHTVEASDGTDSATATFNQTS